MRSCQEEEEEDDGDDKEEGERDREGRGESDDIGGRTKSRWSRRSQARVRL